MTTTALVPMGDLQAMATAVAKSGLFGAVKSQDAALTLLLLAQAEGIHPMQAMRRFDVVDGKPAMKSDAMLGEFQAHGGKVEWVVYTDERVTARFSSPGCPAGLEVSWDMDRARRAGLGGKRNWQTYPRQMLRARVISEGVRATMPAVVAGIYTPEEVADFAPAPAADPMPAWAAPQAAPTPPPKQIKVEVVPAEEPAVSRGAALREALEQALPRHDDTPEVRAAQRKRWGEAIAAAIGRKLAKMGDLDTLTDDEAQAIFAACDRILEERLRAEQGEVVNG